VPISINKNPESGARFCYATLFNVRQCRKLGNSFLFAFHNNYGCIFSRFDTIHDRDGHPATTCTTRAAQQKNATSSTFKGLHFGP